MYTRGMATYQINDRVRVVDPADKRKRLTGTVTRVDEGRGPLEYLVTLDGISTPWGVSPEEIAGRAR